MQNSVGYSCNDIWNKKKERKRREREEEKN